MTGRVPSEPVHDRQFENTAVHAPGSRRACARLGGPVRVRCDDDEAGGRLRADERAASAGREGQRLASRECLSDSLHAVLVRVRVLFAREPGKRAGERASERRCGRRQQRHRTRDARLKSGRSRQFCARSDCDTRYSVGHTHSRHRTPGPSRVAAPTCAAEPYSTPPGCLVTCPPHPVMNGAHSEATTPRISSSSSSQPPPFFSAFASNPHQQDSASNGAPAALLQDQNLCIIGGGTGCNAVVGAFAGARRISYCVPVSDDGGSSSEIQRVLGTFTARRTPPPLPQYAPLTDREE